MSEELLKKRRRLKKLRRRNIIVNITCILLAGSCAAWGMRLFWRYVNYEITNDAMIEQYITPLNIRVAGYVKEVRFTEHQYVHAGDTLLVLDDREFRIHLKDAEADHRNALGTHDVLLASIRSSQSNIAIRDAEIEETRIQLGQQEQEYRRYANLLKNESVSQQQYEQVKADYEMTRARYRALQQHKEAAEAQYTETFRRQTGAEADIQQREAALDMARLNLSYTVLTAPYDGYMGRRSFDTGQYVQAGQTVSYLIRGSGKWVTANYRETQMSDIHVGQPVRIKVDALPGRTFHGIVMAISEATGSKYALVPTDNSAGNFVKVQQRIPVRISIDDATPEEMDALRAGMMVETEALRR